MAAALVVEAAVAVVEEEVASAHRALAHLSKVKTASRHLRLHQGLILHHTRKTLRETKNMLIKQPQEYPKFPKTGKDRLT